jgi:hypothetical protein
LRDSFTNAQAHRETRADIERRAQASVDAAQASN